MQRTSGPMCVVSTGRLGLEGGLLRHAGGNAPGVVGSDTLSREERELLLDLAQMTLDLTGFIDPSPLSDGTNAAISLNRSDWLGAGISSLGLIPYLGDIAKLGKLDRWVSTIDQAVALARRSERFAAEIRPFVRKLAVILNEAPLSMLPDSARASIRSMRHRLDSMVGRKVIVAGPELIERYLGKWYARIDALEITPPPRDRGALWSQLDPKDRILQRWRKNSPGATPPPGYVAGADHPDYHGPELAALLARNLREGKQTLEMVLEPTGFAEEVEVAVRQLAEIAGPPGGLDWAWKEFGQKVWERVSEKYVSQLQGRVTVYVDDQILQAAMLKSDKPILTRELQLLLKRKQANQGITEIVVKDIFDGVVRRY
jgi:hypothetical protein